MSATPKFDQPWELGARDSTDLERRLERDHRRYATEYETQPPCGTC